MRQKENRNPILSLFFRRYLDDQAPAPFITGVAAHYRVGTLERLAQNGEVVERRAALMALTFLGDFQCHPIFGRALADRDRGVRLLAEDGIRDIWSRAGNTRQRHDLARIKRWNDGGFFSQAAEAADALRQAAPEYAEAWNQLGIAQFYLRQLEESVHSCWRTLTLNPYQFEAAVGLGHAYWELNEPLASLEGFRQALRLNPNLESIRVQVATMQRAFEQS